MSSVNSLGRASARVGEWVCVWAPWMSTEAVPDGDVTGGDAVRAAFAPLGGPRGPVRVDLLTGGRATQKLHRLQLHTGVRETAGWGWYLHQKDVRLRSVSSTGAVERAKKCLGLWVGPP